MNLIVNLSIADETVGSCKIRFVIQEGNRVLICHRVAVVNGVSTFSVVPPRVTVQASFIIYRFGRCILNGLCNCILIGKSRVHVHELSIQIEGEMLVKE